MTVVAGPAMVRPIAAMRKAAEIARGLDRPLYIHFGQLWPMPGEGTPFDADAILPEMLEIMRPGDVLAHPFTRHPGGFVNRRDLNLARF